MKYAKPRQLADAISVTTDVLRKQRERGTSPYEYEVIEGRALYDFITLPPSVPENIEKNTTKRTREKHYDIKDLRYWNSIGKRNEQRIQQKNRRIEARVQERPLITNYLLFPTKTNFKTTTNITTNNYEHLTQTYLIQNK